jgi:hypothetical protein
MDRLLQIHLTLLTTGELTKVAGGHGDAITAGGAVVSPGGIVEGGATIIDGMAVAYGRIDRTYYGGFGLWGHEHVSGYSMAG